MEGSKSVCIFQVKTNKATATPLMWQGIEKLSATNHSSGGEKTSGYHLPKLTANAARLLMKTMEGFQTSIFYTTLASAVGMNYSGLTPGLLFNS